MIAPLIELFTSEGCNSCPTADRWLSAVGRPNAGRVVVPLALHVDYWNHLGWEDPYASPDYTRRQYEYAHQRGTRTVYTPQFILNGREFRRWHAANADSEIASVAQTPATATITLSLQSAGERDLLIEASVMLAETMPDADLYFALYENGLTNKVDDGENAGRTLHHDFVARQLLGPFPVGDKSPALLNQRLHLDHEWHRKNLGVAAFVQRRTDNRVLQALAIPLCF